MTFHNINESRSNMTGHFGSGQRRSAYHAGQNAQNKGNSRNIRIPKLGSITPERWVDIVCISLISIFVISVLLNWNAFLDSLFTSVLFPVIAVGAKLLGIIGGVGAAIGFIYAKIRRPRRRWF